MKRKILTLTLTLLVSLLLAVSVSAAEYGVIYTEADVLQSEEMSDLGEYELPQFTETYGIDLRVDVLTNIGDFPSVEEIAPVIYDSYDYGCGDGRKAACLPQNCGDGRHAGAGCTDLHRRIAIRTCRTAADGGKSNAV